VSATEAGAERRPGVDSARRKPRAVRLKGVLWDFGHLAALSSIALAQPLFDLLGRNPEFFAARGSSGFDIVTFALIVVVGPPLILIAVELLVGLLHERLRWGLHLTLVALLVGLTLIQTLKKSVHAGDAVLIGLALAVGALAALAYARTAPARSFMNVLTPVPLVFLFLFLVVSPVSKVAFASEASARNVGGVSRSNLVVVLLDELPVTSLMDDRGRIDPVRYPAFAALARDATWFRNAYTVYDSTERAQPAIFDGDLPAKGKLPTSADHPNSIFTLFAKTHRLNVSEEATSVCPRDLCKDERLEESYGSRMKSMGEDLGLVWLHVVSPPGIEKQLASVSETWGNFGGGEGGRGGPGDQPNTRSNLNRNRNKRFEAWIAAIRTAPRPALNFKHTLLPHGPWQYLPDGRQYRRTASDPIPGLSTEAYDDPYQLDSLYQRHLLQTGFADHELGKLLRHLKRIGLYDKSLIVVASDHGVAFDLGKRDRRTLTRQNAEEIGPIPFFLKAPYQRKGRIDPAYAESVDILPTILDVLDVDPRVRMDGRSAFGRTVRRRRSIRILQRGTFKPLRFPQAEWERRKSAALERKLRLFGVGRQGPLALFRIGPNRELLFKPVRSYPVSPGSGASLVAPGEFRSVDLRSPTVPVHVTGRLKGISAGRELALAVNGRIAAVTRAFQLATGRDVIFAAMVPESSFRRGRNRVEVFAVSGAGGGFSLRRLGGA
jgi:Sulfatase